LESTLTALFSWLRIGFPAIWQKLTLLQAHPEGDFIKICFIKIYVGSQP